MSTCGRLLGLRTGDGRGFRRFHRRSLGQVRTTLTRYAAKSITRVTVLRSGVQLNGLARRRCSRLLSVEGRTRRCNERIRLLTGTSRVPTGVRSVGGGLTVLATERASVGGLVGTTGRFTTGQTRLALRSLGVGETTVDLFDLMGSANRLGSSFGFACSNGSCR